MSKTIDDLKSAFAGESQASQRYLAFARKADQEDYPQVAKLFRAAALAESVHAGNHLRAADGVNTTLENLKEAMGGENYEVSSMYPPMLSNAQIEDHKKAATSFNWALEVEKVHARLYEDAIAMLDNQEEVVYTVCPVCGYTHRGPAPEKCPVCGTPGSRFESVQ